MKYLLSLALLSLALISTPLATHATSCSTNGAIRFFACPIGKSGIIKQTCTAGTWVKDSSCDEIKCDTTTSLGKTVEESANCATNMSGLTATTTTATATKVCAMPLTNTAAGTWYQIRNNCKASYTTCTSADKEKLRTLDCPVSTQKGSIVQRCNGTSYTTISNSCKPVTCGGMVVGSYRPVSGQSCPSGTKGVLLEVCTPTGNWKTSMANCGLMSCPASNEPGGDTLAGVNWPSTKTGSTATITSAISNACGPNYKVTGTITRTCSAQGIWSGSTGGGGSCTAVTCTAPTTIPNTTAWPATTNAGTTITISNPGTTGAPKCTGTFGLASTDPDIRITCNNNNGTGEWSTPTGGGAGGGCVSSSCNAEDINNTHWLAKVAPATSTIAGGAGSYYSAGADSCVNNFWIASGSRTRICDYGGWKDTGSGSTCVQKTCAPTSDVSVTWPASVNAGISNLAGTCNTAQNYSGSPLGSCSSQGVWSVTGSCTQLKCTATTDDSTTHASWAANAVADGTTDVVAATTCTSGYTSTGAGNKPSRKCGIDGQWAAPATITNPCVATGPTQCDAATVGNVEWPVAAIGAQVTLTPPGFTGSPKCTSSHGTATAITATCNSTGLFTVNGGVSCPGAIARFAKIAINGLPSASMANFQDVPSQSIADPQRRYSYSGIEQKWFPSINGPHYIVLTGARGGSGSGGLGGAGARVEGLTAPLVAGTSHLHFVVGVWGQGKFRAVSPQVDYGIGGGGGATVFYQDMNAWANVQPTMIAGGGGGAGTLSPGVDATAIGASPYNGTVGGTGSSGTNPASGGSNGNGGTNCTYSPASPTGGGGAGYKTNGNQTTASTAIAPRGAISPTFAQSNFAIVAPMWFGGVAYNTTGSGTSATYSPDLTVGAVGGYGGGGQGDATHLSGGGGGGYSGGSSGCYGAGGGGGSSFADTSKMTGVTSSAGDSGNMGFDGVVEIYEPAH